MQMIKGTGGETPALSGQGITFDPRAKIKPGLPATTEAPHEQAELAMAAMPKDFRTASTSAEQAGQ